MKERGQPTRVVVLGAGFGGLTFCQNFNLPSTEILLVDRQNHHLFQPLLYQVATAALSATDIAQPVRSILAGRPNITVLLEGVTDIRLAARQVVMAGGSVPYDYLVMALGGQTSYFGHPEWEALAPGLKTLDDALTMRRRLLLAFEKAEAESDPARREQLLTMVVVGGGPTGVELAGAFADLARHALTRDFRRIDPASARVILIEAGDRVLSHLPEELSTSAADQLRALGVEIRTSTRVSDLKPGRVELSDGVIQAENVFWAAGVAASPLTSRLGVETDRAGRVKVQPDLSLPGHPEVFAIGDMAIVLQEDGSPVPGVSPAAMQMARHVVRTIRDEVTFGAQAPPRRAFKYFDKGTMATIGRAAAVAKIGRLEFAGFPAWLAWLFVHLLFLVGLRNKVAVFLQWTYSYFTFKRGARIITGPAVTGAAPPASTA